MKYFTIKDHTKVYVYKSPVNMSCGFPRLTDLADSTDGDVKNGDLFLFVNKKRTYLKILFYARDGMCMFSKKLPTGKFQDVSSKKEMTLQELTHLVDFVSRYGKVTHRLNATASARGRKAA